MNKDLMFSSLTDQWATPKGFAKAYVDNYELLLDVCADQNNTQCVKYFNKEVDGLKQDWNMNFWMNPPYGREIGKWIKKAKTEAEKHKVIGVCLLPARTDTRWFHSYCISEDIRFIKGRLKFGDAVNSAPFPSMVVIYNPYLIYEQ